MATLSGIDVESSGRSSDQSCDEGEKETSVAYEKEKDTIFEVYELHLLESFDYTVPHFTMFHKKLRHTICQVEEDDELSVVDVFFKDKCVPQLTPLFSVQVKKFCYVPVKYFSTPVEGLRHHSGRVMVVWECDSVHVTGQSLKSEKELSPLLCSSDDDSDPQSPESSTTCLVTHAHTVVFKCIGAVRDSESQRTLYQAKMKRDTGTDVPVRMRPEPTNTVDARAIVFECQITEKGERSGMLSMTYLTRFIMQSKII